MNRSLLSLAFVLFAQPVARADMGPFLPASKYARTTVSRIEIADPLPDHVGVFTKSYGPPKLGTETAFVPLVPGTVLEFEGRYHDSAELLIVSRAAAEPYPSANALAAAAKAGTVPAVRRRFGSRETLPSWGPTDITLEYRVRAKASGPEIVRTSSDPLLSWYAVALFFTVAVVGGGLWFARRFLWRVRKAAA